MMFANFLINKRGEFVNNEILRNQAIEKKGGISEDFFWISLSDAFLTPFANYFNLYYIYRLHMR